MRQDLILGISLWTTIMILFFPKEWALALYRGPIGRIWDSIVRVIESIWNKTTRRKQ